MNTPRWPNYQYWLDHAQMAERRAFRIAHKLADIEERGQMRSWLKVHDELREQCDQMAYCYEKARKTAREGTPL